MSVTILMTWIGITAATVLLLLLHFLFALQLLTTK